MALTVPLQRPKPDQFVDFRLCGEKAFDHPAYRWLQDQSTFQRALKKFLRSSPFDLEFAQRIAYCLGHYLDDTSRRVWAVPGKGRKAAARDYGRVLRRLNSGFGPYLEEDRDRLRRLLVDGRAYLLGEHLSAGFKLKSGKAIRVGMLIRELTVHLDIFDLPRSSLTSIVIDLVDLVGEAVDPKTVQRHVAVARAAIK